MARTADYAPLHGNWRLDFRLVDDLPEDSVVGRRFIANAIAGTIAGGALLACAWSGYTLYTNLHAIADWERRIAGADAELSQIERLQRAYDVEAARIDEIHRLVRYPIPLTIFVSALAESLPPGMVIDAIDTRQGALVIRGQLDDDSERASRLVGNWVSELARHPVLGPPYKTVKLTDLERFDDEVGLVFEITLTPH